MSLKAFHIVFITLSTTLSFGFAGWCFREYAFFQGGAREVGVGIGGMDGAAISYPPAGGVAQYLWMGMGGAIAGVALIIYGIYFWKKLKHISLV